MKYALTLIFGVLIGAIGVTGYSLFQTIIHPRPWVVMNVKNISSQDIVAVHIDGKNGSAEYSGVKKGRGLRYPILHIGEGDYRVTFTMADGRSCESGSLYVQSGSSTTEWVSDSGALNDSAKRLNHEPTPCI